MTPVPSETQTLLASTPRSYGAATTPAAAPQDAGTPPPATGLSRSDFVWILCGLYSAVFLGALDGSIVATLLAPIGSYFEQAEQASYIGTSYLLSMCCFTPLYGRLSDILGRKGAMLLALSLFGSGTAYCGFAQSMGGLITARAIAGMGGGGIMTVSTVAMSDIIPLKQRGLFQGFNNILFGMGAGFGGPLGGYLNDTFGWRSAFLFQIPVLAFSFILVALKVNIPLPEDVRSQPLRTRLQRIDLAGSATLVGAVGCFLLACSLQSTESLAWTDPRIVALFGVSVVSGILFVIVESRWAPFPVMPMRLLFQRNMLSACIANFVGSAAAYSMIYNVPLYFSAVRMTSAAAAGAHLLPHSVAISTGSLFAGWLMRKTGKLYMLTIVSAVLSVVANTLVASWSNRTSPVHLWLDVVPQGFGMSSLITSTLIAVIATVSKQDMAVATGITYLFRTTGQVLGVSLSGSLLQSVLQYKLLRRIEGPDAEKIIDQIRHSITVIPTLPTMLQDIAIESYADALRVVFVCQAALAVLMLVSCLPIQENPLPDTQPQSQEQSSEASGSDDGDVSAELEA